MTTEPFYSDGFFETDTDLLRFGNSKNLDESGSFNIDYSNRVTDREFIQTFRSFPGSLTTQERDTITLSAKYLVNPVQADSYTRPMFGFNHEDTDYELVSLFGPENIDQTIQDLYAYSEWAAGDSGLRYSDQQSDITGDDFDDSVSVFSLGYNWQHEKLKVFVSADQNFRFPTVEEHTNVPFGDPPGLKTQEGISLEIGTEYQQGQNRYRVTLYSIDLDNEIAFDSTGFANLNVDETSRQGVILKALINGRKKLVAVLVSHFWMPKLPMAAS